MERKWWTLIAVCGAAFMLLVDITIGLSGSATQLDLARALQGVGGAAMFTTSLALIACRSAWSPCTASRRAQAGLRCSPVF